MRFLITLMLIAAMCFSMVAGALAVQEADDGNYMHTDHAVFYGCWYAMPYLGFGSISSASASAGSKSADPIVNEAGVPLFEYLNDPALTAFTANFKTDFPASVTVRHDGEVSGIPVTVTNPDIILAVFEALRQITVMGEWPVSGHSDDYLIYSFEMVDGNVLYGFVFQDGMLLDTWMGLYEITGFDVLQLALPDPGL